MLREVDYTSISFQISQHTSMVMTVGLLILFECFWILSSVKPLGCLSLEYSKPETTPTDLSKKMAKKKVKQRGRITTEEEDGDPPISHSMPKKKLTEVTRTING